MSIWVMGGSVAVTDNQGLGHQIGDIPVYHITPMAERMDAVIDHCRAIRARGGDDLRRVLLGTALAGRAPLPLVDIVALHAARALGKLGRRLGRAATHNGGCDDGRDQSGFDTCP